MPYHPVPRGTLPNNLRQTTFCIVLPNQARHFLTYYSNRQCNGDDSGNYKTRSETKAVSLDGNQHSWNTCKMFPELPRSLELLPFSFTVLLHLHRLWLMHFPTHYGKSILQTYILSQGLWPWHGSWLIHLWREVIYCNHYISTWIFNWRHSL